MQERAKTFAARIGRTERPRRWWHSFWLWVAVAIVAAVLVFATHSAAAQGERATALIERALALHGDVSNGESLYKDLCAGCHGVRAYGGGEPVTPSLAGQLPVYVIKELVDLAEGDRVAPDMHRVVALKRLTSPQALSDLATYLRGLPPNPRPEVGDGRDLAAGKQYYDRKCAFCHGASGEGNEKHATPSLQSQNYSYLLMQSRRLAAGHRYSVPIEVMEVLQELTFEQLTAIADYASRLPDRTPAAAGAAPLEHAGEAH